MAWPDYLEQCGSLRIKSNEFKTDNLFNGKFRDTKVEWQGIVYGKEDFNRRGNILRGIRIKMEPTDSNDFDILLQTSADLAHQVEQLHEGDIIKFKGTLKFVGNEEYPHVVDASSIDLPTGRMDMEAVNKIEQYVFKKTGRMFGGK